VRGTRPWSERCAADDDALESSISAEITHTGCVRNHTHTLYRRSGQDHRATADRYPHRNTPRKGKTKPNNGCTKPHSSCSQGHGALQHMYGSEDQRRQGKLARSNLSPHRPHTITRLTINPGTRRSTSTHTHTDSLEASEHPPSLHHTRRIQPLPLYQRAALSTLTERPPSHHQPTHHPSEQAPQPPQVRSRWLWERSPTPSASSPTCALSPVSTPPSTESVDSFQHLLTPSEAPSDDEGGWEVQGEPPGVSRIQLGHRPSSAEDTWRVPHAWPRYRRASKLCAPSWLQ
jgi:hypothetical protein